jgi:hypothetical protein
LIDIFNMIAQLSTTLALLAALLMLANLADATAVRKDFDWDIEPREGFPTIAFNHSTATEEVVFLYDTPLLYENKTYRVVIFDNDCKTIGSNAITHVEDDNVDRELSVSVDVDQATITESRYYTSLNVTNAEIGLCVRVDYLLNGDSVNYHETNLTIDIDLTAGFKLDSFKQIRVQSEQDRVNSNIEYPVVVYHCDESSDKLARIPVLAQGAAMQLCVELDPTVNNENVFVVDILSVDLDQEKADLSVAHKNIIDEAIPNPLTTKLCQGGICNVKTQLDSSWFSDAIPGAIEATGMAILAFGSLSGGLGQRFLRAPIVFRQSRHDAHSSDSELDRDRERVLQQEGGAEDDGTLSTFSLATSLKIPSDDDKMIQEQHLFFWIAVLVSLVCCFCCCCCVIGRLVCIRKKKFSPLAEEAEVSDKSEIVPKLESTPITEDEEKWFQAEEGKIIGESKIVIPELKLSKVIGKKSKRRVPLATELSTRTDVTVTDLTLNDEDFAADFPLPELKLSKVISKKSKRRVPLATELSTRTDVTVTDSTLNDEDSALPELKPSKVVGKRASRANAA